MNYLIDLHTHSIVGGHCYSTIQENITAAKEKGLAVYGISEHAPAMPGGPHKFFFLNLKVLPKDVDGVRVLRGCEANIMDLEGSLDLEDSLLGALDYVIASLHTPCIQSGTAAENTDCLIKVMDHPAVRIIGHPDDARYPLEYERLVLAAKEKGILLEVNNTSLSPVSVREGGRENVTEYLKLCKKYNVPVILGSDSHYSGYVGDFTYAEEVLRAVDFPEELVVNTSLEKLRSYIPML